MVHSICTYHWDLKPSPFYVFLEQQLDRKTIYLDCKLDPVSPQRRTRLFK